MTGAITVLALVSVSAAAAAKPGTLDPTFGGRGGDPPGISTLAASGGGFFATASSVDSKDRIVVAGDYENGADIGVTVARFKPNGRQDKSFGAEGTITVTVSGKSLDVRGVTVAKSGDILVAGGERNSGALSNPYKFMLAGFDPTGAPGGVSTYDFSTSSDEEADTIAVQKGGAIVLAGHANVSSNSEWALLRLDGTTLTPDPSFDGDGKVLTDWFPDNSSFAEEDADSIVALPTGRLIVAGSAISPDGRTTQLALARYTDTGQLDLGWGHEGSRTITFPGMTEAESPRVVRLGSGKIVVELTGFRQKPSAGGGSAPEIGLARFTADGDQDLSFGKGGFTITGPRTKREAIQGGDIAKAPHGRLVVGGTLGNGPTEKILALRYKPNGSLDRSFGNSGFATARIANRTPSAAGVAPVGPRVVVVTGADHNSLTDSIAALAGFRNGG
jgi:uncharacterized delta-60 repeat protein